MGLMVCSRLQQHSLALAVPAVAELLVPELERNELLVQWQVLMVQAVQLEVRMVQPDVLAVEEVAEALDLR